MRARVAGNAGSISLTDSLALSVGTVNTVGLTSPGAILLTSSGDIRQAASISTTTTGNAIVLNAAGNFINNAGAAALSSPNGRWLVYSTDPALDTFGGLASSNLALWGKTSANYAPGSVVETGNRYMFGLVPTIAVGGDALAKIYGFDLTLNPPIPTINGLINAAAYGNVFSQDVITGTASVTSTGFAANAAISATPYPVIVGAGTLVAPVGYGPASYVASSVVVLAPTVLNEIAGITMMFSPDTGSRGDKDKGVILAIADSKLGNVPAAQQLPMCR
jgi:hypothetical protein